MAKRWIIFLFISVFLISLVSAVPPVQSTIVAPQGLEIEATNFEYLQQNVYHVFRFRVYNASNNVFLNDDDVNCSMGIVDDKGESIFQQSAVTATGYVFMVNVSAANFSRLGRYHQGINCITNDGTTAGGVKTLSFEVTYSGFTLSTGSSIFYAVLIFLMMILLAGTIYGTSRLPEMNDKDEEGRIMSIKWLKYLRAPLYFVAWMLFVAILYISSNLAFAYLGEQLFAQILFVLFRITFGVTPLIVIVWFVWFFVKFFEDKKFQSLLNRGLYPQTRRL